VTKPIDETWEATRNALGIAALHAFPAARFTVRDGQDEERAKLAAEAPAMARMLLAAEHVGDPYPYCTWCKSNSLWPHEADCPWLALMRRIGERE
jgi:hypothetical protein